MKKVIILSICMMLMTVTLSFAQRAAARKAEITKGLKEEVKLTDAQITSVLAIENEFRPKLRALKADSTMSEVDRKAKSKALNTEKNSKLESAVGKETAQKVEAFYTTLKKSDKPEGDTTDKKGKKGSGKKKTEASQ